MKTLLYKIRFFHYWHASSGLSAGTDANLVVRKNNRNLPLIPGKTLKGLLREAATKVNKLNDEMVSEEFISRVFGWGDDHEEEGKTAISGLCFFRNAELSGDLSEKVAAKNQSPFLYANLSTTAINEKGLAKKHSLRTTEVTIPLTLYASIENFPDQDSYLQQITYCFQWIKRMGLNRNRGLGACEFSILKNN